ncbi:MULTISPECIES: inorganic phosphate transporter [Gordonibacter]|uniref:Inorganic phosphate transporter n=2 Tax=Gordonibacter urolithinfaciens TaxID=1335613 RepID=A0A1Y4FXM7_9ACTN|nr:MULTISPECIES: inorganic phosphate transporter [Gordonibacter]MBS6975685.1 inorganic phosphate transporter [Eggerthellaceae bacterium]GKG89305.1 inorganic phosphate transporter PiT [Gordonibacter pamelaeae]MCB6560949.1 inorganic phosphate transporter [Gordonibacter urolithinfaciens]MCB7084810.1 inorganic phosphate transporter [Gordonibacter urolithinfaciens]MDN4509113.1 inorganic phosphate transporter [Gordonibacter sp. RACS_AR49]
MTIEWATFIAELASNPVLVAVTLLNIGVIVVNGATDAPNAIATVVSTRAMKPKLAILMAAVCNFLGLLLVSLVTSAVAHTIFNMVDFGGNSQQALIALTAAMIAIIVWGAAAWWFGIPTSQSHSLIAGLTGAAIALQGGFGAINGGEWMKVVYGILLSTLLGFFLGWANSKIVGRVCRNMDRKRTTKVFRWAQVASGAGVAFMHGAQDGQKFMSIFVLAITLATGVGQADQMVLPIWLMFFCALNMGIGTAVGGERIIKSVGLDMVKLEPFQGFAASAATFFCLMLSTFAGLPVSTTHTNTTAIMGVGAAKRKSAVKWGIAVDMVKTWVLTFPGCGLLGFAFAHLFLFFS